MAHRLAPAADATGWEYRYLTTFPSPFRKGLRPYWAFLRRSPSASGSYDPLRPERAQRNRVLRLPEIQAGGITPTTARLYEEIFPRIGVGGMDQIRVLLCDGPRLLAWLGAFRPERFGVRERDVLRAVVPVLVERLRLEESLAHARLHEVGLAAALDLLGAAAFLVDGRSRPVLASRAGRELLVADGRRVRDRIAAVAAGKDPRATVLRVAARGVPTHRLVVFHSGAQGVDDALLRRMARAWRLTPRQTQVLGCLVLGDANKVIAEKLGCAVGTVELHVSAILGKAKVESRAAVVAAFWR